LLGHKREYNETGGTGLPRPHLIALSEQFADGAFPVALVAKRRTPDICEENLLDFPDISPEESDDNQRMTARETVEEEEDESTDGSGDDMDDGLPGEISRSVPSGKTNRAKRFCRSLVSSARLPSQPQAKYPMRTGNAEQSPLAQEGLGVPEQRSPG
jgi:hypothetical protein